MMTYFNYEPEIFWISYMSNVTEPAVTNGCSCMSTSRCLVKPPVMRRKSTLIGQAHGLFQSRASIVSCLYIVCLQQGRQRPYALFPYKPLENPERIHILSCTSGGYSTLNISAFWPPDRSLQLDVFSSGSTTRLRILSWSFLAPSKERSDDKFVWNREHRSNTLFARPTSASDISKPQLIFSLHNGTERLPKQYVPCSFPGLRDSLIFFVSHFIPRRQTNILFQSAYPSSQSTDAQWSASCTPATAAWTSSSKKPPSALSDQ